MEWLTVIDPRTGGFHPKLNTRAIYQFKRLGSDEVKSYRLADASPYFNVTGLLWRDPLETMRP